MLVQNSLASSAAKSCRKAFRAGESVAATTRLLAFRRAFDASTVRVLLRRAAQSSVWSAARAFWGILRSRRCAAASTRRRSPRCGAKAGTKPDVEMLSGAFDHVVDAACAPGGASVSTRARSASPAVDD